MAGFDMLSRAGCDAAVTEGLAGAVRILGHRVPQAVGDGLRASADLRARRLIAAEVAPDSLVVLTLAPRLLGGQRFLLHLRDGADHDALPFFP
jgi:hypothetical protein